MRNQQFRLDKDNQLFDIEEDLGQNNNVADQFPEAYKMLTTAKAKWEKEVLSELPKSDERTFPIAHPDFPITQLPARDAKVKGEIIRSNRWPNCSFYTNWKNESDAIFWDAEVLASGVYQPIIYYTCAKENIGHTMHLSNKNEKLTSRVVDLSLIHI